MHSTLETTVPSVFLKSEEIYGLGTSEDSLTLRANETVFIGSIGKLVNVFILVMLSTWMREMRNLNSWKKLSEILK